MNPLSTNGVEKEAGKGGMLLSAWTCRCCANSHKGSYTFFLDHAVLERLRDHDCRIWCVSLNPKQTETTNSQIRRSDTA